MRPTKSATSLNEGVESVPIKLPKVGTKVEYTCWKINVDPAHNSPKLVAKVSWSKNPVE
jgi:hypothetical protein